MSAQLAFEQYDLIASHAISGTSRTISDAPDAEFRFLVQSIICEQQQRACSWSDVRHFYELARAHADAVCHTCGDALECVPSCLLPGTTFRDPANPENSYSAAGSVWVCSVSFLRHVCTQGDMCEYSQGTTAGTVVCSMSGLDKGGLVISCSQYANREQIQAIRQNMVTDACIEATRKRRPPSEKQPKAAKTRTRPRPTIDTWAELVEKLNAKPSDHMFAEVRSICEKLFGTSGISVSCCAAVREASAAIDAEVRKRLASSASFGFADLAAIVVSHAANPLNTMLSIAPSLRPGARLEASDIDYLVGAVTRLLHILRLTPKMNANDNAVSAKGARMADMCVPLLLTLRDGLIGTSYYDAQEREVSLRITSQAKTDADAINAPGRMLMQCVFTPAHPGLRQILPDSLPQGANPEHRMFFDNMMSHKRCITVAFNSVLSTPNIEIDYYRLDHYMRPMIEIGLRRPDIVSLRRV